MYIRGMADLFEQLQHTCYGYTTATRGFVKYAVTPRVALYHPEKGLIVLEAFAGSRRFNVSLSLFHLKLDQLKPCSREANGQCRLS